MLAGLNQLMAASSRVADRDEFSRETEPFRRELLVHCYKMLGSVDEAEDALQETYLRAWRGFAAFEQRSSLRVWLYKIATNASLTAAEQRSRRALPSGLGAPGERLEPPADADSGTAWVQPIPDALVTLEDPLAGGGRRDLRLAVIALLQHLPPRQRATWLLTEVLELSAAEVAAVLDTTVAAVKSTLQRARAHLDAVAAALTLDDLIEPAEPVARAQLDLYIAAFESSDVKHLERVLRQDAAIETMPSGTWVAGRAACLPFVERFLASPGDWRMLPTRANGQPAAAVYLRGADGHHAAWGVAVLETTTTGIARIVVFAAPALVERFGFTARL
jgi:RNA polymerase sigma-70 factor (ECF subfamily)